MEEGRRDGEGRAQITCTSETVPARPKERTQAKAVPWRRSVLSKNGVAPILLKC